MAPRLLVAIGQASEGVEARDYLVELLVGLAPLGIRTQVALLGRVAVRPDLAAVAEVRRMPPTRPRSPAGLSESLARRVDADLAAAVHDRRTRSRRRWIQPPDGVHLNGPEAAPLLRYLPAGLPVTTYVHPHDFNIAGLQPADHNRLIARTDRFLVSDEAAGDDLVAHGVDRARVQPAPDPLIFPVRPPDPSARTAARSARGLPSDAVVIGSPPVPQWIDGPDLTLALAWEVERRRPATAPWTFWYGMPSDDDRRWPIEHDIGRMGLTTVVLGDGMPQTADLFDLVDMIVLPTHTTSPLSDLFVTRAAAHGTPVLCWGGHRLAEDVRGWTDGVIPQPDVSAMADRVLGLAEDRAERDRLGRRGRTAIASELERIVPLSVPIP